MSELDERVLVGGVVSRSGRYALPGRMAAAGVQQAVADVRNAGGLRIAGRRVVPELLLLDDESTRAGVRRGLDALVEADLLIGPYGSDLVRDAAAWAAQQPRALWNHGGSADDVEGSSGVVSVASPASRYLAVVLEALARHRPSARVLVAVGRGGFGQHVARGAQEAAGRLGMSVVGCVTHDEVSDSPDVDALLLAGTFAHDVALVRRLRKRPPIVGAVAAGLGAFAAELGRRAERVLAPSQWEEGVHFAVDVGPRPAAVVRALRARVLPTLSAGIGTTHLEYPSAQAYATVLVAMRCAQDAGSFDDPLVIGAARHLRCTTFFGRFGLGADGRQLDHGVLVVQWRAGVKRIVWPPELAEAELDANNDDY